MLHRRSVLMGLFAGVAAPAIVRASSIMPVKKVVFGPSKAVWESGPWRVAEDGVVECTYLSDSSFNPDVVAEFYRKLDGPCSPVKLRPLVPEEFAGHWYDDPPDPYNGELRPAKLLRLVI